jgi:hypothetical protein
LKWFWIETCSDGADEEMVVAALLHDIGDIVEPYNHGELAAAVLKPFVSECVHWSAAGASKGGRSVLIEEQFGFLITVEINAYKSSILRAGIISI